MCLPHGQNKFIRIFGGSHIPAAGHILCDVYHGAELLLNLVGASADSLRPKRQGPCDLEVGCGERGDGTSTAYQCQTRSA